MPVTRGGLPRHELDGLGESGVSKFDESGGLGESGVAIPDLPPNRLRVRPSRARGDRHRTTRA